MIGNLFTDLPAERGEECFEELLMVGDCRLERIVSHGQHSPPGFWYDQPWQEWVLVLRGAARLRLEGQAGLLALGPGDSVNIPAHCRHRVEWTDPHQPTVWLALHGPER